MKIKCSLKSREGLKLKRTYPKNVYHCKSTTLFSTRILQQNILYFYGKNTRERKYTHDTKIKRKSIGHI